MQVFPKFIIFDLFKVINSFYSNLLICIIKVKKERIFININIKITYFKVNYTD